jgi:hypothetical protein
MVETACPETFISRGQLAYVLTAPSFLSGLTPADLNIFKKRI